MRVIITSLLVALLLSQAYSASPQTQKILMEYYPHVNDSRESSSDITFKNDVPKVTLWHFIDRSPNFISKSLGRKPVGFYIERNVPFFDSDEKFLRATTFYWYTFEARDCKLQGCKDWVRLTKHSRLFWTRSPNCNHNVAIDHRRNRVYYRIEVIAELFQGNLICRDAYYVHMPIKDFFNKRRSAISLVKSK